MNATLLSTARRARAFFPLATPRQRRVQAARYARAITILGERWILARHCGRLPEPRPV